MSSRPLRISENHRRILKADGSPFFYLADTAWQIFHYLSKEDAQSYLATRAEQKFNVIQATILSEFDGLATTNAYGELPLHDLDPTRPNEAYFAHLDSVLQRGAELDLHWALLPTWGDKWFKAWGVGPEVFTPENARVYGEFLGRRYGHLPVIWVLGGDRPIKSENPRTIIRAMADGLKVGDGGKNLVTYHPCGGLSSSQSMHEEAWLDFNMLQSGHESSRFHNHDMLMRDYNMFPPKPYMDSEPPYENHPDMRRPHEDPAEYFDETVARRAAWQALFAGACGHAYGCHDVWQFFDGVRSPVNRARTPWREAVHLPGARQMQHLLTFVAQTPFLDFEPAFFWSNKQKFPAQVLTTPDRKFVAIYAHGGKTVQLGPSYSGEGVSPASWFDTATGEKHAAGPADQDNRISPPHAETDWVLVLGE